MGYGGNGMGMGNFKFFHSQFFFGGGGGGGLNLTPYNSFLIYSTFKEFCLFPPWCVIGYQHLATEWEGERYKILKVILLA